MKEPAAIRLDDLREPRLSATQRTALSLARIVPLRFTEAAVLDAARKRTGLTDFGAQDFRERLGLLLRDYQADDGLTAVGRKTVHDALVRYASNRLLIEDALARNPAVLDEPVEAPIIVVGLPRTGTTHLLNLMAADDRLRSLPLWQSYEPVPSGYGRTSTSMANAARRAWSWLPGRTRDAARDDKYADPRYMRCAVQWQLMQAMAPHLAAMHPMDPDHIHEELELMGPDFASYVFEWTGLVPRYREHYLRTDQTPHYAYMKRVLQLLQHGRPKKRWVLKCPQHLEQLPALKQTFPDATVAFTHRDPVAVLQSIVTMLAYAQRMGRHRVDVEGLVATWTDRVEQLLDAGVRDQHVFAGQSVDVRFDDFMADNLGSVEAIYAVAGLSNTDSVRTTLTRFIDDHPRGKHGRVTYDPDVLRLDPVALRRRFASYLTRFGMEAA